jgi:dipeptidyl aminopeptidase/acylaminoacyl peptidase
MVTFAVWFSLSISASHPYTVTDQVMMRRIAQVTASPDGQHIVYALKTTDLEKNRSRADLWILSADGKDNRRLTSDPHNDGDPEWSADSKRVYFLSDRGGSNQIWRVAIDGGEAEQVSDFPFDLDTFRLHKDERTFVFSAETFPQCPTLACTEQRRSERKKKKTTAQHYDHLMMRHWDTWRDGRRNHLFVWKLGDTPRDLMPGIDMDAPTKPFGDSSDYVFTPDGKALVYTARDPGKFEATSTDLDLFYVPLEGKTAPKKLTTENRATDTQPRFSPDGKHLAYLAMTHAMAESDKLDLVVRDWNGSVFSSPARRVTSDWDRSIETFTWASDSRRVYATADHLGQHPLFAIDTNDGKVTELATEGHMGEPSALGSGVVFTKTTLKTPADLWVREDSGRIAQLTRVNDEALKQISFGDYEQFSFAGAGGDTVYGFLVKPVGFDAKKKYPLAYLIHGGPQGSFGNHFHYRWNPQVYAAAGFVAVMVDFHGSTGYGQKFTEAIRGDWGGKPFEDLQKGLEAVTQKFGFVDNKNVCALGASYGGYMINWIAGKWPDRFKCLVAHDGNLDERMAYYDTEELWFPEWEHGGTPWENPASYSKHNPIDLIGNWKTPMLVIHGGRDYRVVDTQGFSTFTALQRKGIPSHFLYFPDENHWVVKPQNSIEWHDTVLAWLKRFTK